MTDTKTLHIERTFQAPAEAVFEAFTNAEVMRRWWHVGHDWETTEAEVDLRVGGTVRVAMRDPPTRLAFTWIWDDDPRGTLIEVDFEESDGTTTVRFTHSHLWDEETVRSHEDGWGRCFDNLERTLEASGPAN
jgi:uncharacterized protein YndB with AHSA1/START domain